MCKPVLALTAFVMFDFSEKYLGGSGGSVPELQHMSQN